MSGALVPGERPSIGIPIPNASTYVLDERLRPAPIGVHGELYVGGAGVGRGYLHQPASTAERFVPHPFSDEPGARLYRTGDRVRWRADGTLDYTGRLDAQVKLRGHRIEPGEIETLLEQQPGVQQACVMLRDEGTSRASLVAYIVLDAGGDAGLLDETLRSALQASLPPYMVPSAFVALDRMPVTTSGKIDRRALPALEDQPSSSIHIEPRTPLEELLAAIWMDVLQRDRIGVHDNFFASGGHSLIATQLALRIRDALATEFSVRDLFEAQTIAALAVRLEEPHRRMEALLAELEGLPEDAIEPIGLPEPGTTGENHAVGERP
jgi:hypothetical protein